MTDPEIREAATRLATLAAAVPTSGDWRRGDYGDYGWTVHLGDATVETPDDDGGGQALADYLAALPPKLVLALAQLLLDAADQPTAAALAAARAIPTSPSAY